MTDTFKSLGDAARAIVERQDHRQPLLNSEQRILDAVYLVKWFKADHPETYAAHQEVRDLVDDILATLKPRENT